MLALLPDAEPLLSRVRQAAPGFVRSLPAHVSLLYPGPPPSAAEDVRVELPAHVDLAEPLRGESGFSGVAVPELDPAAAVLRARFPDLVPYGGRFGEAPRAHLTLVMGADSTTLDTVGTILADALPLRSRVAGPLFVQRTDDGWRPA
ncbi:2'-5' RNA ligase family protein [Amycolatopsis acidicola]|uniref:2'-5' RNA ligase family protein n=1 Tax=Amycolatopsis acidicola TaxID=2596893 RepID=A0A5N0V3E2_9PSEU|nr:2'-5' RNA ligase family protein [Amycolatopsis acidicola]KAA9159321.1 2'-5' RNA ligase family protein [Amycolatopsis acidicola]